MLRHVEHVEHFTCTRSDLGIPPNENDELLTPPRCDRSTERTQITLHNNNLD